MSNVREKLDKLRGWLIYKLMKSDHILMINVHLTKDSNCILETDKAVTCYGCLFEDKTVSIKPVKDGLVFNPLKNQNDNVKGCT